MKNGNVSSSRRHSARKMMSSSVRAPYMNVHGCRGSVSARKRAMLMTGVMPLPAETSTSGSRWRSGSKWKPPCVPRTVSSLPARTASKRWFVT